MCVLTQAIAAIDDEPKVVSSSKDTTVVEICGRGLSEKSAIRDATRNAIIHVVGQYVDAETITKNEDTIEDNIIAVSNGMADEVRTVAGPERQGNTVLVRVRAKIKASKVRQGVLKFSESKKKHSGSAVSAKREIARDNKLSMSDFLLKMTDNYVKLYKFEQVGDAEEVEDNVLAVTIKGSCSAKDIRKKIVAPMMKAIAQMKLKELPREGSSIADRWLEFQDVAGGKARYFDLKPFFKRSTLKDSIPFPEYFLSVECLDEDGEVVASNRLSFRLGGMFMPFGAEAPYPPAVGVSGHTAFVMMVYGYDLKKLAGTTYTVEVRFASREDLESVKTIKISVVKEDSEKN